MITHSFGIVNYLVLFGYLLAMMLVGVYFSRRQKTADDYFRGGGRVPGWAAGVSVFATTLSSITFMSIPAKAFTSDWTFIIGQYLAIAILPLVFYFYIPFFRKLKVTSAYEYLEARFMCAAVYSPACHLCCFISDVSPLSLSSPCWPCAPSSL